MNEIPEEERVPSLEQERDEYKRKLALIFDQSCYSDSLGVPGSGFSVCRWCGGGSGPGGSPPFTHNNDCLMDDSVLERKVSEIWNHDTEIECLKLTKELATAEEKLSALQAQVEWISVDERLPTDVADMLFFSPARWVGTTLCGTQDSPGAEGRLKQPTGDLYPLPLL